jgi:hypothetical protein
MEDKSSYTTTKKIVDGEEKDSENLMPLILETNGFKKNPVGTQTEVCSKS